MTENAEAPEQTETKGWEKCCCAECGMEYTLRPGAKLPWTCGECQSNQQGFDAGYEAGLAEGLRVAELRWTERIKRVERRTEFAMAALRGDYDDRA